MLKPRLHQREIIPRILCKVFFTTSLIGVLFVIYEAGFEKGVAISHLVDLIYRIILIAGIFFLMCTYLLAGNRPKKKVMMADIVIILVFVILVLATMEDLSLGALNKKLFLNIGVMVFFIRAISAFRLRYNQKFLNPAQIFIISFISLIVIGTFLLMLPNATYSGIGLLDALFTSTSAVCVTGLIVVDTGTYFTAFGQWVILLLIQAGGIGIMTFTSYFGYFFKGGASYQNRLMIQDVNNTQRFAEVFSTLRKIILTTFIIELAGAFVIYLSIDREIIALNEDRIFFSVFHSISGFCNAGFSTLQNSLYETGFRYNYFLHTTIAMLFIIGGLGFPIVFNAMTYIRHLFNDRLLRRHSVYTPWILALNTRIVLITTLLLLVSGTLFFYLFEYDNTLAEHSGIGKVITAFFGSATTRTAGFNSVDTSALHFPTLMIVIVLMWIGASPGSTGGGIKTSTFAIAILNILSLSKGKDRIEVFKREISPTSSRRAFAILTLSIIVIGLSILLLAHFDGEKGLLPIAVESFSAFGTVGLSLGITSQLSDAGKAIIILTMFIGRVSMLTIMVAFLRRMINLKYKYPIEDMMIN